MLFVAIRFDPQSSKYSTTVISVCSKKKKGGGSGGKIIKRNTVVSHQSWLAKCRLQEENPYVSNKKKKRRRTVGRKGYIYAIINKL